MIKHRFSIVTLKMRKQSKTSYSKCADLVSWWFTFHKFLHYFLVKGGLRVQANFLSILQCGSAREKRRGEPLGL